MKNVTVFSLFLIFLLPIAVISSELDDALALQPDKDNGEKVYRLCATCHGSEGWGNEDGSFPVIAGQHRKVIIKQLADIRARNRDNPTMFPFSDPKTIGGAQAVSDVAEYISHLPVAQSWGQGQGGDQIKAKALYDGHCIECHGDRAQGIEEAFFPKLQGQHFHYLVRQMDWMKNGRRKNANPIMVERIKALSQDELSLIADYVSRL